MRRVIALTACLAAGVLAALAITRPARAGLDCATNTVSVVAGATLTNKGFAWSSPAHPDPLWTVDLPSLNASYDLQAPDDPSARAAVKTILDNQLAALGCNVTTTTAATTTAPPPPVTTTVVSTQTQTTTQTVSGPGVIVFVPQPAPPAQTVTDVVTVTTPAPTPKVVTVKAKPVACKPAAKKKPAKKRRR